MDRKILVKKILQLEKEMNKSLKNAISEMNNSTEDEMINIAKKYCIGKPYLEYHDNFIQLKKDYFFEFIDYIHERQNEGKMSRDTGIKCLAYLMGSEEI